MLNSPFLRTSRNFPTEPHQLTVEVNKSYLDIANAVNFRTLGIFTNTQQTNDGESWFITNNQRQQGLRQVFKFTTFNPITHNINFSSLTTFTRIYGVILATDGNYIPLPYVNAAAPNFNVGVYVTPTQINFTVGAPPFPLSSGIVILEWISNP